MVEQYRECIERKEILKNPSVIDYQFRPEIIKIFGKGGTLEK